MDIIIALTMLPGFTLSIVLPLLAFITATARYGSRHEAIEILRGGQYLYITCLAAAIISFFLCPGVLALTVLFSAMLTVPSIGIVGFEYIGRINNGDRKEKAKG